MDAAPSFAADAMLGTLARWLRLLGYDCFYERDIDDERLVEVAKSQARVLLTRDRAVAARFARSLYIPPGSLDDELFAVLAALEITPPERPPTTRCGVCNSLLGPASRADIEKGQVPRRIRDEQAEVWCCPQCKRLYWQGTHIDTMAQRLARLRGRMAAAVKTVK